MNILMTGQVMWSYPDEIAESGLKGEIRALFSFVKPLHHHEGEMLLTDSNLIINGDIELNIPFTNLSQLFLGFDVVYKSTYVKNTGVFWQPLRISYYDGGMLNTLYLIIDHSIIGAAKDRLWFDALPQVLSE
ncbi:hypothetical protein [Mucilaginibacter sp. BT774]|uniref:hypothetical protein n=1 Tax=Mucilaginibacter sp. BT774 TaxID=3062276 RepID=UPI0026745DA1|nr:hypothetical protein [Mucilaginibacter sp. BT774]MDO3624561.1 hypothetical protein [Mucilaginibacter sp. BT774]